MLKQRFNTDVFEIANENDVICINTNQCIKENGELVMGVGIAKQAKQKYPGLAKKAGELMQNGTLKHGGRIDTIDGVHIYAFNTKDDWKDNAKPEIIAQSANRLATWINKYSDKIDKVYLPAPGCGYGGLKYEKVYEILKRYLSDCSKDIIIMRGERFAKKEN